MRKRIYYPIVCLVVMLSFGCGMVSCGGKQKTLKELYQDKNFNIKDPSWEKILVKVVGKDNYKFMCEQDVTYGPYKRYFVDSTYMIGGSTKDKWKDGYQIEFSISNDTTYNHTEGVNVEIVRNGEVTTYPNNK